MDLDLDIPKGDTDILTVSLNDKVSGTAVNIASYTVTLSVKRKWNDSDDAALIFKSAVLPSNPAAYSYDFSITTTDSSQAPGRYVYSVQFKAPITLEKTTVSGNFTITNTAINQ